MPPKLNTPTARLKLDGRPKPYWVFIARSTYLGYRRSAHSDRAGSWSLRVSEGTKSRIQKIALADDYEPAAPPIVLDFEGAKAAALKIARGRPSREQETIDGLTTKLYMARETIKRLEGDLYMARSTIIEMAPRQFFALLHGGDHTIETLRDLRSWRRALVQAVSEDTQAHADSDKVACPLCHRRTSDDKGWKLPFGLQMHLGGEAQTNLCPVVEAAASQLRASGIRHP